MAFDGSRVGYRFATIRQGDGLRSVARCSCARCGEALDLSAQTSTPPQTVAKVIRRHGWKFDLHHPRTTRCPKCLGAEIEERRGESGAKPAAKVVTILGKHVEMPAAMVAPKTPDEKPTVTYEVKLTTRRSVAEVTGALAPLGEVTVTRATRTET